MWKEWVGGLISHNRNFIQIMPAPLRVLISTDYPVHNSMTETTGGGLSGNTMCHNSFSCRHSNDGVFYQTPSAGKAWLGVWYFTTKTKLH